MSRKASRFLCLVALVAVFPKGAWAEEPLAPVQHTRMRNPKLVTTGVVLLLSGLASVPLGLLAFSGRAMTLCQEKCNPPESPPLAVLGVRLTASGIGSVLTSIPLIGMGATYVPVKVSGGPSGSTGLSLTATF
jgi:hypothetical protein